MARCVGRNAGQPQTDRLFFMKLRNIVPSLFVVLLFLTLAAAVNRNDSIYILDPDPAVTKLKVRSSTQTNPWVEFYTSTGLVFSVPANGILPIGNIPVRAGTVNTSSDGTVTNAFSPVFASVPVVVTTPIGSSIFTNQITSVTTSNFVLNLGASSLVANWVAVGL